MRKEDAKTWMEEARQNSISGHGREKVVLRCKKCKMEACCGSDLYIFDGCHITVPEKRFKEEKLKKSDGNPQSDLECDDLSCIKCGSSWGVMMIWMDNEFPLLKCKAFNFEIDGTPICLSKWSKATFKIPPIMVHPEFLNIFSYDGNNPNPNPIKPPRLGIDQCDLSFQCGY